MVFQTQQVSVLKSGLRTCAGTTDTYTFPKIKGKILKVEFDNKASTTTTFKAYTLTDLLAAQEYIAGGAAATITVGTTSIGTYYPQAFITLVTDGTVTALYNPIVIYNQIKVDVSTVAAADQWEVTIYYEP